MLHSAARRVHPLVVVMIVLLMGAAGTELAPAPAISSNGYLADLVQTLAPGVEYRRLVRSQGPVVAHVVRVQQNPSVRLQAVLSNDRVDGPPPISEPTSEMCRRVRCIAAINGDFSPPDTSEPVGGVAHRGRVLRSPVPSHDQVTVSGAGGLTAGPVSWSGRLVGSDLGAVMLDGINRQSTAEGVFLYTPEYGPSTKADSLGAEILLRILELPTPPTLGQTSLVELVSLHEGAGGTPIPPDGAVLSGHGAGADELRALWKRSKESLLGPRALFQLETSPPMLESIGGSPILLREGRRTVLDRGSDFVMGRHPRTMVGWNGRESFLVAVDGRQPGYSIGLTLVEGADLLARLGATEGINLDGGGSTTLAVGGTVVNQPSDRLVVRDGVEQVVAQPSTRDALIGPVERPVADALAVVPTSPLAVLTDLLGPSLEIPGRGVRARGLRNDPASRP